MRILGLDPGLRLTGYGLVQVRTVSAKPELVDAGVIRLDTKSSIAARLDELERELVSLIDELKPDTAAVETLYAHYAHPRTAILMGHARGVLLLVAQRKGLAINEFAANRIKQAISGHGHASKVQMQRAVQSLFRLARLPEPPDVADALAVALCCAQHKLSMRRMAGTTYHDLND
ncbi:MAG: crossover junction endodeoxyribonuclease RuvC [Tepidisphaerales bacterium]